MPALYFRKARSRGKWWSTRWNRELDTNWELGILGHALGLAARANRPVSPRAESMTYVARDGCRGRSACPGKSTTARSPAVPSAASLAAIALAWVVRSAFGPYVLCPVRRMVVARARRARRERETAIRKAEQFIEMTRRCAPERTGQAGDHAASPWTILEIYSWVSISIYRFWDLCTLPRLRCGSPEAPHDAALGERCRRTT